METDVGRNVLTGLLEAEYRTQQLLEYIQQLIEISIDNGMVLDTEITQVPASASEL